MAFQDWLAFKKAFKNYIRTTIGLFTLLDNTSFTHFELDYFLERQANSNRVPTVLHIEMLMALSSFMDIEEGNIHTNILPHKIKLFVKDLINRDLLLLNPYSKVKSECINYFEEALCASATAA